VAGCSDFVVDSKVANVLVVCRVDDGDVVSRLLTGQG
jgi:hypothetical protein